MFDMLKKLKNMNPILATEQLSQMLPGPLGSDPVRRRLLDVVMTISVPFNRWLGLKIKEVSPDRVTIESPEVTLRKNHVGTAHACAQALIGEYAAGLVVAQHYSIEDYRIIIGKLEIDYGKAGRGTLWGTAEAPSVWPELEDEEGWVDMQTRITDKKGNEVSVCRTRWQVKSWEKIARQKMERGGNSAPSEEPGTQA